MTATASYVPLTTDRLITIERGTPSRNTSGGEVLTWATLCQRWASVIYTTGSESSTSKKETASITAVFSTRYVTGLTEKDRIKHDEKYFDITQIVEKGRRHYHTIYAEYRR